MQAQKQTDFFTGLIMVLFCLVLWLAVFPSQIPKGNDAVFPQLVTLWLFFNGLILVVQNRHFRREPSGQTETDPISLATILVVNVLYLLTIIAISFFGFHIPVFLFLVVAMRISGEKSWPKAIVIALVVVSMIHLIIETIFNYALP